MKTLLKSLSNVIAACALLALTSADAWSQTACDLVLSLADLAAPGEFIDHKTDIVVGDCTIQVEAKVDKSLPSVTKVDFKIDRSCSLSGQTQLTGIALDIPGDPPTSTCNIDYDNPADSTEVGEDTLITDVPEFQQLIEDAANATATQYPSGSSVADELVALLGGPADLLAIFCVDSSDRTAVRALRDTCDGRATAEGYNVGIFRPHDENRDFPAFACPTGNTPFSCLGAPHQDRPCQFPNCGR